MNDAERFRRKWRLFLGAITFCVLGLMVHERMIGRLSPQMEVVIFLVLCGALTLSLALVQAKSRKLGWADAVASGEAVDERKRRLVGNLKKVIVFLLVGFTISEWLSRDEPLLMRIISTGFGLILIGGLIWLLLRLQRSLKMSAQN